MPMIEGRLRSRIRAALTGVAILLPALVLGASGPSASAATATSWSISSAGSAGLVDQLEGSDAVQAPEFPGLSDGSVAGSQGGSLLNRSHTSSTAGSAISPAGQGNGTIAGTNPELQLTFDGLNHRQNRRASGGNQFSLEPPDQGICAGNGFVLETVNDVLRVFDTSGNALGKATALNAFYHYAPSINRTPGATNRFGPFVTDPSCYYDPETQRWFHTVLTIDVNPVNGRFLGPNHLDTAVSVSADPTGAWKVYRLPVQDDGSQGTPNHHCTSNGPASPDGPCFGDYPHIGTDANGFYISTNEYSFFGPEFHGAQVYAFSKRAMAAGNPVLTVTQFDTHLQDAGNDGFTLAPATSPGHQYEAGAGGTEYLLSSNAGDEAHGDGSTVGPRTSNQVLVWAVTNTSSLNNSTPSLNLSHTVLTAGQYSFPAQSDQKAGTVPLKDCLNNNACVTNFILGGPDPFTETEVGLDSSDTRMLQTTFAAGQLWGALDTALAGTSKAKAGVEWFVIRPSVATGVVTASTTNSGYLGLPDSNVTYPAIGVTAAGKGVMALTVVGGDRFPSAGYALIDVNGTGTVHVAAEGVGPDDGFSGYKVFGARPRWGDYGATAVVGNSVWLASEYINQNCDLKTFVATGGSCGATRTAFANWGTRISLVTP